MDMDVRKKKALLNIKHAANDLLGGLENTMLDYEEDEDEYKRAKAFLGNHEKLVEELYDMAINAIYGDGYCCFNEVSVRKELRDIRFCGKEWLMERCELVIRINGY